ncbi:ABC transporter substrate-binding protein [Nocardiopsis sp. MG754419]|nr:ABC transporter substrate-binding protein [Nocardiopsis sp. MG754419]
MLLRGGDAIAEPPPNDAPAAVRDSEEPFIFGTTAEVRTLDPFLATEQESLRASRQVFETLLRHDSEATIVGGLAEEWEHSEDGTEWTFHLREDVRFHDGDDLDAEAVCANFDRWHHLTGDFQDSTYSYYWQAMFGGFAENESDDLPDSDFVSCEATDDRTTVITLAAQSPQFPGAFTLASFGIMSPSTVEEISGATFTGNGPDDFPEYSRTTGTLAGTGPFTLGEWDQDLQELTLERFDDHWAGPAGFESVILRAIDDRTDRHHALAAGDIDGYDQVAVEDVASLTGDGFQLPDSAPFNLLYLGVQQEAHEALEDPKARQALAHAIDRQSIVDTAFPPGSEVATQFVPSTVDGWSSDVPTYDHDPDLATALLEDVDLPDDDIVLCYPDDTSRSYMPDPQEIATTIGADLADAGVSTEMVAYEWTDYVARVYQGDCALYLLGWTGDFNEAHNFVGPHFADHEPQFGFRDEDLFDAVDEAASLPDPSDRAAEYQDVNVRIMEALPAVPIASAPTHTVYSADVEPPGVSALFGHENLAEGSWR